MGAESRFSQRNPAKVLIADDQALYREGLREIMGHWREFEVVGEAANGWNALTMCRKRCPDLVIMDNMMPMMDGIEATRRILAECEGVRVVVLTVSAFEEDLVKAFDAGARGFLLKETPSRQLRGYLKEAVAGELVVSSGVARTLLSSVARKPVKAPRFSRAPHAIALDDDERALVELVARGLSNEAIGTELYMSPGSVKKRLRAVMEKLGLSNRVQVAVYAVRHGIVGR